MNRLARCIGALAMAACGNAADGAASSFGTESGGSDTDEAGQSSTTGMSEAESTAAEESETDDPTPVFDVPMPGGEGACEPGAMGPSEETRSYIWISNMEEHSLTKLNTVTMVEEGRYYVREDNEGSPSRTSVALSGKAAVANRFGGISVFYANLEDCPESNGIPGLQTSSGAADILPWNVEECRAWHVRFEQYEVNRPVAWAPGDWDAQACAWTNEKLWTSGSPGPDDVPEVVLLDGETGVAEARVSIPEVVGSNGMYGAAVDGDGNLWALESETRIYRVDRETMEYQVWEVPGDQAYGVAVDYQGRPWVCGGGGASRLDEITGLWQIYVAPNRGLGGCQTDGQGTVWHGRWDEGVLVGIDTDTVDLVAEITIPDYVHGVSVDFQGNVWGVTNEGSSAYRVNPETGDVDTYDGLVGAYTYSDMTGLALSTAGTPAG